MMECCRALPGMRDIYEVYLFLYLSFFLSLGCFRPGESACQTIPFYILSSMLIIRCLRISMNPPSWGRDYFSVCINWCRVPLANFDKASQVMSSLGRERDRTRDFIQFVELLRSEDRDFPTVVGL